MKKLIYLIVLTLVCCHHNIPISKIEFEKIEKSTKHMNYYSLYFSSDEELINSLNEYSYTKLDCFFLNKRISKKDYNNIYEGYKLTSIDKLELIKKNSLYNYKMEVYFTHSDFEKSRDKQKIRGDVQKMMQKITQKNNDCLSCTITAASMLDLKKRYISETMCLPKIKIKKVLKKRSK